MKDWNPEKNVKTIKRQDTQYTNVTILKDSLQHTHYMVFFTNQTRRNLENPKEEKGTSQNPHPTTRNTKKEILSKELLLKLKQMVELGKEATKVNVATDNPLPFTSFLAFLKHRCFFIQNRNSWIIDIGATYHMCMGHMVINNKKELRTPNSAKLGTNQTTKAYQKIEFSLNGMINLTDVLQFNDFDVNLISVAKLTHDLITAQIFSPTLTV